MYKQYLLQLHHNTHAFFENSKLNSDNETYNILEKIDSGYTKITEYLDSRKYKYLTYSNIKSYLFYKKIDLDKKIDIEFYDHYRISDDIQYELLDIYKNFFNKININISYSLLDKNLLNITKVKDGKLIWFKFLDNYFDIPNSNNNNHNLFIIKIIQDKKYDYFYNQNDQNEQIWKNFLNIDIYNNLFNVTKVYSNYINNINSYSLETFNN
jgi:hypothetical protein